MPNSESPHPEFAQACRELQAAYRAAVDERDRLEAERGAAMWDARQLTPPLTFREIAQLFSVTVGATQIRVVREQAKRDAAAASATM